MSNSSIEELSNDLAEIIELKLMGIEVVHGRAWHEYATDVLEKYHISKSSESIDSKPLWRSLYEKYCSMDKSYSPNIIFMQMIKSFKQRLEIDFPLQEINRSILLDYLEREAEKAMECD